MHNHVLLTTKLHPINTQSVHMLINNDNNNKLRDKLQSTLEATRL